MEYNSDLNQNLYNTQTGIKEATVISGRINNAYGPTIFTVGSAGIIRDGHYNVVGKVNAPKVLKIYPLHPWQLQLNKIHVISIVNPNTDIWIM